MKVASNRTAKLASDDFPFPLRRNDRRLSRRTLRPLLRPGQRLLGLDLGEKTIGLALSDTSLTVATPLKTLKRGKFKTDAAVLAALIAEHGVGGLIVGLPLNMDGSDGPSAQSARAFARNFAAQSVFPLRWSTSACRPPP